MHVVHLIAVVAQDEVEATAKAASAIESFGEGNVWDWFEEGGRWAGMLNGKNVLCAQDDPEAFKKFVEGALKSRDNYFCTLRNKIIGKEVTEEEVPDDIWGIPIQDKKEAAKRTTEQNKQEMGQFLNALRLDSLPRDAHSFEFEMIGHHLYSLGKLMAGYYCFDSFFYDGEAAATQPQYLFERLEKEPEKQWIVAMDLHN